MVPFIVYWSVWAKDPYWRSYFDLRVLAKDFWRRVQGLVIFGHNESNSKKKIFYCYIIVYFSLYFLTEQWNDIKLRFLLNFCYKMMIFMFICVQFIQNISILMHLWTHQFWKWWSQTDFDESRTHGLTLVRTLYIDELYQIWILLVTKHFGW